MTQEWIINDFIANEKVKFNNELDFINEVVKRFIKYKTAILKYSDKNQKEIIITHEII